MLFEKLRLHECKVRIQIYFLFFRISQYLLWRTDKCVADQIHVLQLLLLLATRQKLLPRTRGTVLMAMCCYKGTVLVADIYKPTPHHKPARGVHLSESSGKQTVNCWPLANKRSTVGISAAANTKSRAQDRASCSAWCRSGTNGSLLRA